MSFFDSRISRLQSLAILSLTSFSMLAEWLDRLTTKKRNQRPKQKHSLSGPALQGRMLSQECRTVDEGKPEGLVGVLLSESLCRRMNGYPAHVEATP